MPRQQDFLNFRRRICILELEPNRADAKKLQIDRQLRFLTNVELVKLKGFEDPKLIPCDLLIVYALYLDETELLKWLKSFESRLNHTHSIWVPSLIINDASLNHVEDLLEYALKSNWYFDILKPDALESLTLRVANLLRIHDHLHELRRYEKELRSMQDNITRIEEQLSRLQNIRTES